MPTLIKGRRVVSDSWVFLADEALVPESGPVYVTLKRWLAERESLSARTAAVGVLLSPADDPENLASDIGRFALIAVEFPAFTDGRGYSTARLLRERYGYQGEMRAVGDVLRDQVFLLARCGFDALALRDDQNVESAIAAFADFSEVYQNAADRPGLFARRLAASAGGAR